MGGTSCVPDSVATYITRAPESAAPSPRASVPASDNASFEASVVAVAHKAVIRALYAEATGWPMLGRPPQRLMEFALHLFAVAADGKITVGRLNLPLAPVPERRDERPAESRG